MSNANEVALRLWEETTYGELATGNPKFTSIPFTSESLRGEPTTVKSQRIRSDRFTEDHIRTSFQVSGDVDDEQSYGAHDLEYEAGLLSAAWTAAQTNAGTFSTSGSTITGTGVGTGVANGQTGRLKDGSTVLGYFKVSSGGGTNTLTVTPTPPALTGGGDEEFEVGGGLLAGTQFRSFNAEKEYSDLTNEFSRMRGMAINTVAESMTPEGVITTKFGWIGKDEVSATATLGDGSPTAAATTAVMNTVDHVFAVWENNTALAVRSFDWQLSNNLEARSEFGTLGPASLRVGSIDITGNIEMDYTSTSRAVYDKALSHTDSSLQIILVDSAGNAYSRDLVALKFTPQGRNSEGINTDVTAKLAFVGKVGATEAQMMRVQRWAA